MCFIENFAKFFDTVSESIVDFDKKHVPRD